MNQDSSEQAGDDGPHYRERTPADYLDTLPLELRSSFSEPQLAAVQHLLAAAIPKSSPKLVDLRFWVDFLAYRYHVVFFVGKDRRHQERPEPMPPMVRKVNAVTALLLTIGLNVLITSIYFVDRLCD